MHGSHDLHGLSLAFLSLVICLALLGGILPVSYRQDDGWRGFSGGDIGLPLPRASFS